MVEFRPPFRKLNDVEVFAVDATSVQISWRNRTPPVTIGIAGRPDEIVSEEPAGVVELRELVPATDYKATVASSGGTDELDVRTSTDPGTVVTRLATISDLHLGSEAFGLLKRLADLGDDEYTLRCAVAAVREAQEWGAELMVLKGDITDYGKVSHWKLFEKLLGEIHIPVLATPGNHDTFKTIEVDPQLALAAAGLDTDPVQIVDRPGVRLILADTTIPRKGSGRVSHVESEVLAATDESDRPVMIALHHNIQRTPVAWFWPPGISSVDARGLVAGLEGTDTDVFLTSGHTHRHRRHRLGSSRSLLYTEVGSTSDYPGTWAGYEISNSMIRQVVRRIADPSVVAWTERTLPAAGGLWPRWSPGALDDRCVDLELNT